MAARIQRLGSKRRAVFVGVMLTAAAVLGAGYAYGTITATNNQYTGCLLSGNIGNLAVGSTPTKTCQNPAVQITWSQSGPQGPPGITGAPGAKGETGATGPPGSSPAAGSSCPTGAFVVGFDATGAIVCSSGSSSGGSTDTDGDGRPDSLDPCPSVADTIVDGVRYCPATVYDVNDGAEPAGSAVCLIDALVTGVSGSTATLAIDPGDPGYLGAAGSTIAVDFSDLPPTPSAGHRATVCGTVLVGPAFSPTQVTVLS